MQSGIPADPSLYNLGQTTDLDKWTERLREYGERLAYALGADEVQISGWASVSTIANPQMTNRVLIKVPQFGPKAVVSLTISASPARGSRGRAQWSAVFWHSAFDDYRQWKVFANHVKGRKPMFKVQREALAWKKLDAVLEAGIKGAEALTGLTEVDTSPEAMARLGVVLQEAAEGIEEWTGSPVVQVGDKWMISFAEDFSTGHHNDEEFAWTIEVAVDGSIVSPGGRARILNPAAADASQWAQKFVRLNASYARLVYRSMGRQDRW